MTGDLDIVYGKLPLKPSKYYGPWHSVKRDKLAKF